MTTGKQEAVSLSTWRNKMRLAVDVNQLSMHYMQLLLILVVFVKVMAATIMKKLQITRTFKVTLYSSCHLHY